jgi:hypothetical protein
MFLHEVYCSRHQGCEPALHVGGPASVKSPVAHDGLERGARPVFERTCWNDIGVPGQRQQGRASAVGRPQVGHVAERHRLQHETGGFEPLADECLAAGIVRRQRTAAHERAREFEYGVV